jgi:hypothetical protein
MNFLKRLRRDRTEQAASPSEPSDHECPHYVLVPRWDDMADMGNESRASGFRCDACGQEFTPGEAQALRATEAERLRQLVG